MCVMCVLINLFEKIFHAKVKFAQNIFENFISLFKFFIFQQRIRIFSLGFVYFAYDALKNLSA